MTKRNLEHLFMMQSLLSFARASSNQPIVVQVPAFDNGLTTLQTIVNQVTAISGQQSFTVSGAGSQKTFYREQLNQLIFPIINASKGYAISINDFVLAKLFSMPASEIAKTSDKLIADKANAWKTLVAGILPQLANWGVTQASLDALSAAITNYLTAYQLPIDNKNAHKQLTIQVNNLLDQGTTLCKDLLDTSVNGFTELGYIDFVAQYHVFRKLQHTATRRITPALRSYVTNQLGMPITEGELFIIGTDKNAVLDDNGHVFITHIPAGAQMITLTTHSGTHNYGPFNFEETHILKINFQVFAETEKATVTVSKEKAEEITTEEN